MTRWLVGLIGFVLLLASTGESGAQAVRGSMNPADKEKLNANRVGIVTGPAGLTYIQLGADLAKLLDDHENLEMRVIVQVSRGSLQNIDDLLNLQKVDLAMVQSDVLDYLEQRAGPGFRDIKRKIGYVTRLYDEEVHVLARAGIAGLADLKGRRVNIGEANSGAFLTATNILGLLGLEVQTSLDSHDKALDRLRSGDIDAMFVVAGKPAALFEKVTTAQAEAAGLHFVPIPDHPDLAAYQPGRLTAETYPSLVPAGQEVPTRTVQAVLAVFLWPEAHPRHAPLAKFTRRFIDRFDQLKAPGFHRKWQEVDLTREQPGWTRFPVAQGLLKNRKPGGS